MNRMNHLADEIQIILGHRCSAWQAESYLEKPFGDGTAAYSASGKDRLKVHWFPQRAGFNIVLFQFEPDIFSRGAELVRIDCDASQPTVTLAILRFGHEINAG